MFMSVSKLQKQLMRDLKRSPGKAAVLAILCVVAIWFWAPLLFGGKKTPPAAKPADATVAQAVPTPAIAPPAAVVKGVAWHRVVEMIEGEPRMRSAQLGTAHASPFGSSGPRPDGVAERAESAPGKTVEASLDPAKFKVTSTLLGPRRRVAVINGRPYAEGDELEAYLIARVTDRGVFLEKDGRRFELSIQRKSPTPDP